MISQSSSNSPYRLLCLSLLFIYTHPLLPLSGYGLNYSIPSPAVHMRRTEKPMPEHPFPHHLDTPPHYGSIGECQTTGDHSERCSM
ncbi:uncharacterized protein F5147DRAFT_679617 [Suillus discolor]|uniref:Secreted protein n=1 Tax=Suillus discolor TaxID=1912936 RepID=A0A9P7JX46_9AGAM|nr:uncharacterized protein F5147DRAFT_679617 [Suillus discolor]KAG2113756.1 hypothetical protein F5147DRAFT_679617 [Suillus discolor]